MKPMLPSKPVNRFSVTWWEVVGDSVHEHKATYYENAPFKEVIPDYHCQGLDFVREWHLEEKDSAAGCRMGDWDSLAELFADEGTKMFCSEAGAIQEANRRMQNRIERMQSELHHLQTRIKCNRERLAQL